MIVSLEKKIKAKEWVVKTSQESEEGVSEEYLIVESKEGYEFIIAVDTEKEKAEIIQGSKTPGEKYTITYEPNGATTGEAKTVEVRSGFYKVLDKNTFTKEDYVFVGWCEKQKPDIESKLYLEGSKYQAKGKVTLYAIWKISAKAALKIDATATTAAAKSPYVRYNNLNCRVLYNDDTHGIQIITAGGVETFTSNDMIGWGNAADFPYSGKANVSEDFKKAAASYNNLVDNLNKKAKSYMDTKGIALDARCIGSKPVLADGLRFQDDTSGLYFGSQTYMTTYGWNNRFKDNDDNCAEDRVQINSLGLRLTNNITWFASRSTTSNTYGLSLMIRYHDASIGDIGQIIMAYVTSGGVENVGPDPSKGAFRPVFLLPSSVVISGGNGSERDPYIID